MDEQEFWEWVDSTEQQAEEWLKKIKEAQQDPTTPSRSRSVTIATSQG
jgi:hypothetical protein